VRLIRQIVFHARLNEAQPAIIFAGGIASYGTMVRAMAAAAEVIDRLDLPKGTMVMLDVINPFHHCTLMLTLGLMGISTASVSSAFSVEHSGVLPSLLLTDRPNAVLGQVPVIQIDDRWFAADAAQPVDYASLLARPGFADPSEIVRCVYTSGTTGFPKCVALSAAVLEARVLNWMLTTPTQFPGGSGLNMLGFSTVLGIIAPLLSLPFGEALCFANGNVEALQMIRTFKVEALSLMVGQLQGFLQVLGSAPPPPSLRIVVVGGSRIAPGMLRAARAKLCSNIAFGYGSTEMGNITGGSGDSLERAEGSAGYVRPWVEMQVVDANGNEVPRGADGIIRVRSPEMAAYAGDSPDPVETIRDGWFYPGDVGQLHADGLVVIVSRTTEIINRGGVVVAPEFIEEVLRRDPQVRDVAVVGVPVNGIEEIWAGVVSDNAVDAPAMGARAYASLNEKTPNRILRIDAVPRNENGKVKRAELRELLVARVAG